MKIFAMALIIFLSPFAFLVWLYLIDKFFRLIVFSMDKFWYGCGVELDTRDVLELSQVKKEHGESGGQCP